MAEVEKLKDKILVLCDCGAIHKITKNPDTEELELSSSFKQKTEEKKENPNGQTKQRKTEDIF